MFIVRIKNGLKAKGNRRGTRKNILCEDQEIPLKEFWYTSLKTAERCLLLIYFLSCRGGFFEAKGTACKVLCSC